MRDKILDNIIYIIRSMKEEAITGPTNNVGSGNIAGTPEADPGNPPVFPGKRKKYAFLKGSRRNWMQRRNLPKG